MSEEFKKAAQQLRGMVKVGVVDGSQEKGLTSKYKVEGFPTLLLFPYGEGKASYETHDGARHATAIANFAVKAIPSYVTEVKKMEDFRALRPKDSSSQGLVLLFTDKKKVPPMLSALSKDYKDKLKFGIVYASSSPEVVSNGEFFGLVEEGQYPALLVVEPAKMTKYKGNISYLDIRRYLLGTLRGSPTSGSRSSTVPQHIFELNKGTLPHACSAEAKALCVVAFVSPSTPSRDVVTILEKVQSKYGQDGKFTFSWVDERRQSQFRAGLPFVSQSPEKVQLVVINPKRLKFVEHEGKLEASAISSFLDRVLGGDKKWVPLSEIPPLAD